MIVARLSGRIRQIGDRGMGGHLLIPAIRCQVRYSLAVASAGVGWPDRITLSI